VGRNALPAEGIKKNMKRVQSNRMGIRDGHSLVDYLNENNSRFVAKSLDFTGGCWVLVADTEAMSSNGAPRFFDPIADFERYLTRARQDNKGFPPEFVTLLKKWFAPLAI